jgi:Flp pilus assembly protein TadD
MKETRPFPFGGVPVYNPQSLSKGEALAQFHARQAAYVSLMDLLREESPSHVMIIGTRGMGKTTLLQRVRYGVEDDASLNKRYLALVFPEEQYNVNRLHHFLLNTVDALADAVERIGNDLILARIEAFIELAGKYKQEEIEQRVPQFLAEVGQAMDRSLLLLVDNADRLFETIEDREQWRLRELLASRRDLTLFGATAQASDGIYGTDRAFFEFFKVHRLMPLTFDEVRELLLQLSESVQEADGEEGNARRRVEEWLAADAARLRTLVQLTGGNPRTTVLLFHLVLDGLTGSAREYLEQLLDQCTPNYKGRLDDLPSQAQQVLDAVALRWDPVTAMDVASVTGLETTAVSTQLTRLVRQGLLEKADPGDSKKALYQVAERFFNIWYLMRASRRVRAKLRWFVEFLRVFFDSGELEEMALERFQVLGRNVGTRSAEIETAFAYVLASGTDGNRIEEYLRQSRADIEQEWRPYLNLIRCPAEGELGAKRIGGPAKSHLIKHPDLTETEARKATELDPDDANGWRILGQMLIRKPGFTTEAEAALRKATQLEPQSAEYWVDLAGGLQSIAGQSKEAETALCKAIELDPRCAALWVIFGDLMESVPERQVQAEAAIRRLIEVNPKIALFWVLLGDLLGRTRERRDEGETALRKAIELDPKFERAWEILGNLLARTPDRQGEAETALLKAIDLNPSRARFWTNLGSLLARKVERWEEAQTALCKATELDPKYAWAWVKLGNLLARTAERREEAEAALRKAIGLDPKDAFAWASLGELLDDLDGRREEAEAALRKAIELDPMSPSSWTSLGMLLESVAERSNEAEAAFCKAVELGPKDAWAWVKLGNLLARTAERREEAEAALRKAIDLDPKHAFAWASLGELLEDLDGRREEAEAALRKAIELDPMSPSFWASLGILLERVAERKNEAEAAFCKAAELDPKDAWAWAALGNLLAEMPGRLIDANLALSKAVEVDSFNGSLWNTFGVFLACRAGKSRDAEAALRRSVELDPDCSVRLRNLGVLLYCELQGEEAAVKYIRRAYQLDPKDHVSAAILAACVRGSEELEELLPSFTDESRKSSFWDELLELCQMYAPFGKILLEICDIVQEQDNPSGLVLIHRAAALAQLGDFPRASVALEDALVGDPIDLLSTGRKALETFFAAAVRGRRVQDCLELIDKKEWKDAWRPIYEALKAVEAGSVAYLKRVAVEIRDPALVILRRIAPELPG